MREKFEFTWEVDDGYVAGRRPHNSAIYLDDLYEHMTDDDLVDFFEGEMMVDFNRTVSPYSEGCDAFVAWAKEKLAERSSDD